MCLVVNWWVGGGKSVDWLADRKANCQSDSHAHFTRVACEPPTRLALAQPSLRQADSQTVRQSRTSAQPHRVSCCAHAHSLSPFHSAPPYIFLACDPILSLPLIQLSLSISLLIHSPPLALIHLLPPFQPLPHLDQLLSIHRRGQLTSALPYAGLSTFSTNHFYTPSPYFRLQSGYSRDPLRRGRLQRAQELSVHLQHIVLPSTNATILQKPLTTDEE